MLVLVVGPSGVGKDTLLDGARMALAGDPRFVFPRREITRPAEAGGEDHIPVDHEQFAVQEAAGGYGLSWRAHGLAYGIGAEISRDLALDRTVVVNVSRAVLDEARLRFGPVRILVVTADPDVLSRRLAARGRESAADMAARLARAEAITVSGEDVVEVCNDGTPEQGIAQFVAALRRTPGP